MVISCGNKSLTLSIMLMILIFFTPPILESPFSEKGCFGLLRLPKLDTLGKLAMVGKLNSRRINGLDLPVLVSNIGNCMSLSMKNLLL